MTTRQQSPLRQRFEEWWEVWGHTVPRTVPKEDVFAVVEQISQHDPVTPQSSQRRSQRDHIWYVADDFVVSSVSLHPDDARRLGIGKDLIDTMMRVRDAGDPPIREIIEITPTGRKMKIKHTGNKEEVRLAKQRRELSASLTGDLLTRHNIELSTKKGGLYRNLTEAWFEIATEKEFGASYEKCRVARNSLLERLRRRPRRPRPQR